MCILVEPNKAIILSCNRNMRMEKIMTMKMMIIHHYNIQQSRICHLLQDLCVYAGTARDSRANLVANRSKANNSRKTILLMMMMEKGIRRKQ